MDALNIAENKGTGKVGIILMKKRNNAIADMGMCANDLVNREYKS